jgi:hypothetical protein
MDNKKAVNSVRRDNAGVPERGGLEWLAREALRGPHDFVAKQQGMEARFTHKNVNRRVRLRSVA